MKANEIQIGDWVYSSFYYGSTKPCRITGIRTFNIKDVYAFVYIDKVEDIKDINSLTPIPLTPEILKNNGFVYFHKNFASLSYEHPFKLEMVEWPDENGLGGLWTVCNIIKIQFVHELQHALRLCGITREIIL